MMLVKGKKDKGQTSGWGGERWRKERKEEEGGKGGGGGGGREEEKGREGSG